MNTIKRRNRNKGGSNASLQILVFILILLVFSISFVMFLITSKDASNNATLSVSQPVTEVTTAETTAAPAETTPVAETTPPPAQTTAAPPVPVDTNANPVPETADAGPDYFTDAVFVGDSLSVGLRNYAGQLKDFGTIDGNRVLAIQGINIETINTKIIKTSYGELTILDTIQKIQPKKVYIMLGSNGIAWIENSKMIEYYSAYIDKIRGVVANPILYVLSIPPVTKKWETEKRPILNTDINAYNGELLKLANDKGAHFVDLNSAIRGADGLLPAEYDAGDGMHFQKPAYETMLTYLRKHTAGA